MTIKDLTFKQTLVLLFLFKSNMKYETWEIMQLLSLNLQQVHNLFDDLYDKDLIDKHGVLKQYFVTEIGEKYIYKNYMNNIDIKNLPDNQAYLNASFKERNQELFIPKNFKNKAD